MRSSTRCRGVVNGFICEVPIGVECIWIFEVCVVVVGGVGVHVEICACGDGGVAPFYVFDAASGQADGDYGPEAEGLFDECCDEFAFFFYEAAFPGIVVGVLGLDFFVCALLDFLAVGRGEVGDALGRVSVRCLSRGLYVNAYHDEIAWYCV